MLKQALNLLTSQSLWPKVTSLDGYEPLDSIEEGAPIGHGVNQFFGSAEGVEEALLDESTTNITVEEGVSLEGFSGVDSVSWKPSRTWRTNGMPKAMNRTSIR